ncbi:unnamed protein product [Rotaria sp. Silwood1]|nr:unnamed protein product [Rotaria sp. Silwood1]CAF3483361.1 unnamed protein product [Rotaria sp. Silwood1]CAF3512069.1 unnamed protein product [Rotaria sp. Silwood1]CAF4750616.1 unnamed protein product [Rotaria sp. Silwood1]CAF4757407.1 unnamed protein product [Rotaria sp. Silwood1]
MSCCFNVAGFFCTLCAFIGLTSLVQLCLGIYLTFIQIDIVIINRLIKTDKIDSSLAYILIVFIGLGFISLILAFFSIYGMAKRNRPLSLFVSVLWVFTVAINLVMFTILILYYYVVFPQLHIFLIRSLHQSPSITRNLLDFLQTKYTCCGINNKDDYNNLLLDSLPSSCCRVSNCWRDTGINNNTGLNTTMSLMHTDGCYPIVNKYITFECLIIGGITGLCALLQILAITFMCILNQRYQKSDDNQKFVISHIGIDSSFNENINNNNNNNIQGSSNTIEEIVEVTQI